MERQIMGNIFRLCAKSRRQAAGEKPVKNRGYGRIMELLYSGEGFTQQEIAARLDIRPQSASEALSALSEQGFIRKEAMEGDRRCKQVFLTEAGRAHHAQMAQQRAERARTLFSGLTDGEKRTFLMLLEKVNDGGNGNGK